MEASISRGRIVVNWLQSMTTRDTLCENIIVRLFAWANNRISAVDDPTLLTINTETTQQWCERRRKHKFTEWPRLSTVWRCGRVTKTYVLHSRDLALRTSRCQTNDTFQIQRRSSKHPGNSFNMMVQLHLNCQKAHLFHQLCLQRPSLENKRKYEMPTK